MTTGFRSYLYTALWSSMDGEDHLDANYDIEDFDEHTLQRLEANYTAFFEANWHLVGVDEGDEAHFAHNLWLTQNGHGAGFWDGDYAEGETLTVLAEKFGTLDLYVGDDNKIYA